MAETPQAYVVHETPSRVRLKVPDKRHDAKYFADATRALSTVLPGARIETNASTGSILLSVGPEAVVGLGADAPFRVVEDERAGTMELRQLSQQFGALGDRLTKIAGGATDMRMVILLALLLSGLFQLSRGRVLAPAMTLFWYAGEALRVWAPSSDPKR